MAKTNAQDNIFYESEGDQWFERNAKQLNITDQDSDPSLRLLAISKIKPKKVIEVGCSTGWRLAEIKKSYGAEVFGVDPSPRAINAGRKLWPAINLERSLALNIPTDKKYDLVIVDFVLHWIGRGNLLRSLAEIDRVVAENGYLLIDDFYPAKPTRVPYHHLPAKGVFTYKIDYPSIFEATGMYKVVHKSNFEFSTDRFINPKDSNDRGRVALLKKSSTDYYELVKLTHEKK